MLHVFLSEWFAAALFGFGQTSQRSDRLARQPPKRLRRILTQITHELAAGGIPDASTA
jgi:hypothetical protein